MRKHTRIIIATTAAVGMFLPLTACGSIQDKIEKKVVEEIGGKMVGGDLDIDTDEGGFSITGDDGESMTLGSKTLPEDWPADMPLPQGAELLQSVSITDDEDGDIMTGIFTAPGETRAMAEQVSQAMTGAGYPPTDQEPIKGEMGDIVTDIRTYESAEFTVMVSISNMADEEGDVSISYYLGEPDYEE